jgi:hypothetical protein
MARFGDINAAAAVLGSKPGTLRQWLLDTPKSRKDRPKRPKLPVLRVGASLRFDLDALERMVAQNKFARPMKRRKKTINN